MSSYSNKSATIQGQEGKIRRRRGWEEEEEEEEEEGMGGRGWS